VWLARGEAVQVSRWQRFTREQAMDWLDSTIDEGRMELEDQHATEREVEAWDMSCRIAFLVEIVPRR
jgi:hypothetical protein